MSQQSSEKGNTMIQSISWLGTCLQAAKQKALFIYSKLAKIGVLQKLDQFRSMAHGSVFQGQPKNTLWILVPQDAGKYYGIKATYD